MTEIENEECSEEAYWKKGEDFLDGCYIPKIKKQKYNAWTKCQKAGAVAGGEESDYENQERERIDFFVIFEEIHGGDNREE